MLILILINIQYLQNVVFSFEKYLNGQINSSSDFHLLMDKKNQSWNNSTCRVNPSFGIPLLLDMNLILITPCPPLTNFNIKKIGRQNFMHFHFYIYLFCVSKTTEKNNTIQKKKTANILLQYKVKNIVYKKQNPSLTFCFKGIFNCSLKY